MDQDPPGTFLLKVKLCAATLALVAERMLAAWTWLILWLALFAITALLGLGFPFMGTIFCLGALVLLVWGWARFSWPSTQDREARLEQDSLVSHRPLRGLADRLDDERKHPGASFWNFERSRRTEQLGLLGWVLPRFHFVRKDPHALRIALILMLVTATVSAGDSAPARLRELIPAGILSGGSAERDSAIKILIMPPAYTQKPYILLTGRPHDPVEVPQGSTIKITVQSSFGYLSFRVGDETKELSREGDTDVYSLEAPLPATDTIALRQFGLPRLSIPVSFIQDQPPAIALDGTPEITMSGQMRIPLTIRDDYGIRLIRLRAILSVQEKQQPLGDPVLEEQSLLLPSAGKDVEISPRFDLTGHPWAGYQVSMLLEAEDHASQSAQAEPLEIRLPVRPFRHPVAQSIVSIRKLLIAKAETGAMPAIIGLSNLLARPQTFDWDHLTTLTLRSAASRLGYDKSREALMSVISTLWLSALHLEDGNLTTSQNDVLKALQELQKAMQDKASPEEVARLMQKFKDVLAQHMMAMQKEIQRKIDQGEITPLDPEMMSQTMDMETLNDFLNQLENDMMNGDTAAAMKKLESLQKLTDMMNPEMAQGLPPDVKKDMEALKALQDVIDRQQALLDKTRSLSQQPGDEKLGTQKEKAEQEKIDETLSGIMPGGTRPDPLAQAGKSMGQSAQELGANSPSGSIPHQQDALDALRDGREQMQQALKQKLQKMTGISLGPGLGQRPQDPLGRQGPEQNNGHFSEDVEIPNGAQQRKADEILKTIRERSGEMERPLPEREYYQRLLRQW